MRQLFAIIRCSDESGGLPAPIGSIVEIPFDDKFQFDDFIFLLPSMWLRIFYKGKIEFIRKLQLKDFWVA